MAPLVSVIVPTYNRAAFLPRVVAGVTSQKLVEGWEIVVVDDGSTDATPAAVPGLVETAERGGGGLEYVRLNTNRGANVARNVGIAHAAGKYLAFLDSDDCWHPEKLSRQLAEIRKGTKVGPVLSYTGRYRVDGQGRVIARQYAGAPKRVRRQLSSVNCIGPLSSVIVDVDLARRVGGFDESLPSCQDWDFFLRMLPHGRLCGVPEPLLMYLDAGADRISEAPRKRFWGHAAIYRRHMERSVPRAAQYPFWLDLAEDLDDLGHSQWSRRFLSYQHLLRGEWDAAWRLFWGRGPLRLREARYARYATRRRALDARREADFIAGYRHAYPMLDVRVDGSSRSVAD